MIYFTLDKILESKNLTKYWLSKETGIDNNTLAKICNNDSKQIKLETLDKICVALKIEPNDILEFKPNIITGDDALKIAEEASKYLGYDPIPTDDEYYKMQLMQDRIDMEYDLESNLSRIVNNILSNTDLSSLPPKIQYEIEVYQQMPNISFSYTFIPIYRSFYYVLVREIQDKKLIDFMTKVRNIYVHGGLSFLSDDNLRDLTNESIFFLEELEIKHKD